MREIKDFCKWLGVNEKIAKVIVWLLLVMVSLIIINAAFDSLGLPYYKITVDNLSHINSNMLKDTLSNLLVTILNFYSIIFLVFSVKDYKKTIIYLLIYLIMNYAINTLFGYGLLQYFIIIYILATCYFLSNKNWKYIIFGVLSFIINTVIQSVWFVYKLSNIDCTSLRGVERLLLSLDFFIIMMVIISIKEIIIKKKRGEKRCLVEEQEAGYGLENSTKKKNLQKK